MRRLIWTVALVVLAAAGSNARPAAARSANIPDFRVLSDSTRVVDPNVNRPLGVTPPALLTPRVLIAGDSWAQYMWDDGSHNLLLDRFGHEDKRAVSLSLGSDPGPGHTGPEYSISGSEARQWADTANYPWIANMVAALEANPTIDTVVLSIGGNDILAGKSGGGWYKDMDLDVPGSEAALFARIEADTRAIIDAALAVRPEIRVLLSSYDYPNFNVGFWCFVYACPKRQDLSRNPSTDLITDAELNDMMVRVETERIGWVNDTPRLDFDHGVGLMHYRYGDGVTGALLLPAPGQEPPLFAPFPGGNPLRPTLRSNFRRPNNIDADPIHLNVDGYRHKIVGEIETHFFPTYRGEVMETVFAEGGVFDGWADGVTSGSSGMRVGDTGAQTAAAILSFDTSIIPDGATVTRAVLYVTRDAATGTNPFTSGLFGAPRVDVIGGVFGNPEVEPSDATAVAQAADAGIAFGSAAANGDAIRIELTTAGLAAVNALGRTQLRLRFTTTDGDGGSDYVTFRDGEAAPPAATGFGSVARYMGTSAPFLDLSWVEPSGVADGGGAGRPPVALRAASPNPFGASTTLRFALADEGAVQLDLFDVGGRHVRRLLDGLHSAGHGQVTWDGRDDRGRDVPPGVYFARLVGPGGALATARLVRVER
jgi:hypothetical protein